MSEEYSPGDRVQVISLGRSAEVVQVIGPDRYELRLGSLKMNARGRDIKKLQGKARKEQNLKTASRSKKGSRRRVSASSVDLHGLDKKTAREVVEQKINDAVMQGLDVVEIVHGRGSGALKDEVHKILRELSCVKEHKLDSENPGVTKAYL